MNTTQTILVFLADFSEQHGWMPTLREICDRCDISSKSVVNYHLHKLVESGHIERELHTARAIRITEQGGEYIGVLKDRRYNG